MNRNPGPHTETGVALVIVLWLLMLLGLIAASFAKSMHVETSLAQQTVAAARTRAAAEAAIHYAIVEILKPPSLAQPIKKKRFDGRVYTWNYAGAKVQYRIQDESGRIDLNEAQADTLNKLLLWAGADEKTRGMLVGAITDWKDEDQNQSLNGAEDSDYEAAGKTYGAKDGPFNTVEELQRVLGMTPKIYKRIEPLLTVYSHAPQVNQIVAPRGVRTALQLRSNLNNTLGGPDSKPKASNSNQNGNDQVFDDDDTGGLSGSSNLIYTLQAQAEVDGFKGPAFTATVRLQQLGNQPFTVLYWREGGTDLAREDEVSAGNHKK
jgi:general secretion pathway protein K